MLSVYVLSSLLLMAAPAIAAPAPEDDDYNFSWLDPDKKVNVLQNRKYRKAMRPYVVAGGGLNLSNAFRSGYLGSLRGGFWASEQFGVEALGAFFGNADNATLTALKNRTTVLPFVREIRGYFGGLVNWAPFYAKLNFFNSILYFDWLINAGLGQVSTANDRNSTSGAQSNFVSESHFGFFFGTALNFYLSKNFSIRFDLQGVNYGATGADDKNRRFTSFDFTAGVGFML